eukprot:TRINITY_DN12228_c0_g1_i1.p1 TRINITY_DN12228_c0_g1~~TRINITY_DN12228_c0_g1_i1.p1  ORF type:complete len:2659 (+),score=731.76 TRINITY_DN12228_c0_g1_i1:160-7977(+)
MPAGPSSSGGKSKKRSSCQSTCRRYLPARRTLRAVRRVGMKLTGFKQALPFNGVVMPVVMRNGTQQLPTEDEMRWWICGVHYTRVQTVRLPPHLLSEGGEDARRFLDSAITEAAGRRIRVVIPLRNDPKAAASAVAARVAVLLRRLANGTGHSYGQDSAILGWDLSELTLPAPDVATVAKAIRSAGGRQLLLVPAWAREAVGSIADLVTVSSQHTDGLAGAAAKLGRPLLVTYAGHAGNMARYVARAKHAAPHLAGSWIATLKVRSKAGGGFYPAPRQGSWPPALTWPGWPAGHEDGGWGEPPFDLVARDQRGLRVLGVSRPHAPLPIPCPPTLLAPKENRGFPPCFRFLGQLEASHYELYARSVAHGLQFRVTRAATDIEFEEPIVSADPTNTQSAMRYVDVHRGTGQATDNRWRYQFCLKACNRVGKCSACSSMVTMDIDPDAVRNKQVAPCSDITWRYSSVEVYEGAPLPLPQGYWTVLGVLSALGIALTLRALRARFCPPAKPIAPPSPAAGTSPPSTPRPVIPRAPAVQLTDRALAARSVPLDVLRLLGTLHIVTYYHPTFTPEPLRRLAAWGDVQLPLLFVLSGFCMAVYKAGDAGDAWALICRRFVRMYPLYFLSLLMALPLRDEAGGESFIVFCLGGPFIPSLRTNILGGPSWHVPALLWCSCLFCPLLAAVSGRSVQERRMAAAALWVATLWQELSNSGVSIALADRTLGRLAFAIELIPFALGVVAGSLAADARRRGVGALPEVAALLVLCVVPAMWLHIGRDRLPSSSGTQESPFHAAVLRWALCVAVTVPLACAVLRTAADARGALSRLLSPLSRLSSLAYPLLCLHRLAACITSALYAPDSAAQLPAFWALLLGLSALAHCTIERWVRRKLSDWSPAAMPSPSDVGLRPTDLDTGGSVRRRLVPLGLGLVAYVFFCRTLAESPDPNKVYALLLTMCGAVPAVAFVGVCIGAVLPADDHTPVLEQLLDGDWKTAPPFKIYWRLATRGRHSHRVAESAAVLRNALTASGLPRAAWEIELVTELALMPHILQAHRLKGAVTEVVVPDSARGDRGLGLADAAKRSSASEHDWVVTLDGDAHPKVGPQVVRAVLQHCRAHAGDPLPCLGVGSARVDAGTGGAAALAESLRLAEHLSLLTVPLLLLRQPLLGVGRGYLVYSAGLESAVGWAAGDSPSGFVCRAAARGARAAPVGAPVLEQAPAALHDAARRRGDWLRGVLRASRRLPLWRSALLQCHLFFTVVAPLFTVAVCLDLAHQAAHPAGGVLLRAMQCTGAVSLLATALAHSVSPSTLRYGAPEGALRWAQMLLCAPLFACCDIWAALAGPEGDSAAEQLSNEDDERRAELLVRWRGWFEGAPPRTDLPMYRPAARQREMGQQLSPAAQRDRLSASLGREVADRLSQLATEAGATHLDLLLAGFAMLLGRYTREDDVAFFYVGGSHQPAFPIRMHIDEATEVRQFVQKVHASRVAAEQAALPTAYLAEQLNMPIQLLAAIGGPPPDEMQDSAELPDIVLRLCDVDSWELVAEYSVVCFEGEAVVGLFEQLQCLMEQMRGGVPLAEVSMVSSDEYRRAVYDDNQTEQPYPKDAWIHTLFQEQASLNPSATALIIPDGSPVTYGELHTSASNLARSLRDLRIGAGCLVAVIMDRGIEQIVAVYGILYTGAAYVPIDPYFPETRVREILEDTQTPMALVCHGSTAMGLLTSFGGTVLSVGPQGESRVAVTPRYHPKSLHKPLPLSTPLGDAVISTLRSSPPPSPRASPADPVYVMYTSGTTGRPKGVVVTHDALVKRIVWMEREYKLLPSGVLLMKTPFIFGVNEWEMFWPLTHGLSVVVAAPMGHKDVEHLLKLVREFRITHMFGVSSFLQVVLQYKAALGPVPPLRHVIQCGEALPATLAHSFYQAFAGTRIRLHNLYGPTEASMTYWRVPRSIQPGDDVLIGAPIDNTTLYLLDQRMRPVPAGVPGEIYFGGIVAREYLFRPDLTEKAFLGNPFGSGRLYKTGDLAVRMPGGLKFCGRADRQVKVRGFRIELQAVEEAMREGGCKDIAVVATDEEPRTLVAYLGAKENVDRGREACATRLPPYMVPSYFIPLDEMPTLPSGKYDLKGLAKRKVERVQVDAGSDLLSGLKGGKPGSLAEFMKMSGSKLSEAGVDSLGMMVMYNKLMGKPGANEAEETVMDNMRAFFMLGVIVDHYAGCEDGGICRVVIERMTVPGAPVWRRTVLPWSETLARSIGNYKSMTGFLAISGFQDSGLHGFANSFSARDITVVLVFVEMAWVLDPIFFQACKVTGLCERVDHTVGVHRWYLIEIVLCRAILVCCNALRIPPLLQVLGTFAVGYAMPARGGCISHEVCTGPLAEGPFGAFLSNFIQGATGRDEFGMLDYLVWRYYVLFAAVYLLAYYAMRPAVTWAKKVIGNEVRSVAAASACLFALLCLADTGIVRGRNLAWVQEEVPGGLLDADRPNLIRASLSLGIACVEAGLLAIALAPVKYRLKLLGSTTLGAYVIHMYFSFLLLLAEPSFASLARWGLPGILLQTALLVAVPVAVQLFVGVPFHRSLLQRIRIVTPPLMAGWRRLTELPAVCRGAVAAGLLAWLLHFLLRAVW